MLVTIYNVPDYEERFVKKVSRDLGVTVRWFNKKLTVETASLAVGSDAVCVTGSTVDADVLETLHAMGIKHVSTRTIGYDHIDIEKAKALGMTVSNARYQPYNVADFTVMLMLMMLRHAKISVCRALVNDFSLDSLMGREMRSLTIGILGTGKIGAAVARDVAGFGSRILAYDKFENPNLKDIVTYGTLDEVLSQSDIITLHMPLFDDTYHIINDASIEKMKDGAVIINTARGALIDTGALIEALESGKIGGAAIDSVEEENGVMHVAVGTRIIKKRDLLYLKQFPNVVYTQHYGFFTEEGVEAMMRSGLESVKLEIEGRENPYRVF